MRLIGLGQRPRQDGGDLPEALRLPAQQQPDWADSSEARRICARLAAAPPVIDQGETDLLQTQLTRASRGAAFVVHGGDCAETFADTNAPHISANLAALTDVARIIRDRCGLPVVRIARMAGQFAKPRSSAVDASGLPSYRGDMVNSAVATEAARRTDPRRLAASYDHSVIARNLMRHFDSGVFSSHEALVLDYERALVRSGHDGVPYSGSAHFLWVGERTRQLDGAHIAFAQMVRNPVGVKIGPTTSPAMAAEYVERLDPLGIDGRLTLISRMGCDLVQDVLPPIIERVAATGLKVVWQCDPMHGNTRVAADGLKTRHLDDIVKEVSGFFGVHRQLGTHPGGVHLELTGEDVTECVGGAGEGHVAEESLSVRYRTACDPRLNGAQARELAMVAAELLESYLATMP